MAVLAGALWIGRPKGLCDIYRGYLEGRASGALVFSIVQAVGESASRGFTANN